jgi:hypothetical protein
VRVDPLRLYLCNWQKKSRHNFPDVYTSARSTWIMPALESSQVTLTLEDPPPTCPFDRARNVHGQQGACTYERRTTCERPRPTPRPDTRRVSTGRRPSCYAPFRRDDYRSVMTIRFLYFLHFQLNLFIYLQKLEISLSEWLNFVS